MTALSYCNDHYLTVLTSRKSLENDERWQNSDSNVWTVEINISFVPFAFWSSSFLCNLGYLKSSTISNRCVLRRQAPVFAPKSSQTGGAFRSTRRWRGGGVVGGSHLDPTKRGSLGHAKIFPGPEGFSLAWSKFKVQSLLRDFAKYSRIQKTTLGGLGRGLEPPRPLP